MPKTDGLSQKEKEFIRLVLITQNQSEAYRQAFRYRGKNADVMAAQLMVKPSIKAEIEKLRSKVVEEFDVSLKSLVQITAAVAHFDLGEIMTWGPGGVELRQSVDIDPRYRKAIQSIGEHRNESGDVSFTVKAHDKLRAVEILSKMLGYFKDGKAGADTEDKSAFYGRLSEYFRRRRERSGQG